ncbi:hypothetical protein ITI46_31975 [Streptomyces oryzae]|uniref:Carbon monoxide dehydrogenase subunit G n=1 Tax=Streptomyces oryzae TaxID=1434886 RepID=A0ABS3XLF3_9ACTN|nr:hypothetical protein [Streptomyces oryzae]MBO8196227.1 hypothetical protein [Streptomyces oryzae]
MEHEVYVPLSVGSVRAALADSARVARCVPGFQQEPEEGAEPSAEQLAGRLKVRIGGSTITYRGTLSLTPRGGTGSAAAPDALERLEVTGRGTEARGDGTVELALTVEPRSADDGEGTALVCVGTVTGTGRLAAIEEKTTTSAGVRLLDRFAAALGDSIRDEPPAGSPEADTSGGGPEGAGPEEAEGPVAGGIGAPGDNERAIPGIPEPEPEPDRTPLFETEVPPSSLGRDDESELDAAEAASEGYGEVEVPGDSGGLGAEAAHARRTMIGRSAEEVDHAPPRGRYAPVPAPEPASATATLRWAAPAAAAVVAGAVVLGRALRRRR